MTDTNPDTLADALGTMRTILDRVEALARRNRRQRWMIFGLALILAVLIPVVVIGFGALHDLHDLTVRTERTRIEQTLDNCRVRNSAARGNRDRFAHFYDALGKLFPSDAGQKFVADLRAAAPIPDPKDEDIDCNADGTLDAADYPTA